MGIKKGKGNLGMKDYKDYRREMASKGELHALDTSSGGLFGSRSGKQQGKMSNSKSTRKLKPLLPVWQDRNFANRGTKLNY